MGKETNKQAIAMKIEQLLQGVQTLEVRGDRMREAEALCFDSRQVRAGSLFFAVEGTAGDGHDFIPQAVEAGAVGIVCMRLPQEPTEEIVWIVVPDSSEALGEMASAFYGHPSAQLRLVGVTGTNGKTTTATLLYDLFRGLGYRAGLISTVVYRIGDRELPSTHTTPDALRLNAMLAEMVADGCEYCFMEVSSHSIVQRRIAGLTFAGGVFTNITHDHLDYHKTFAEYIRAKKRFFDGLPRTAFALVNADDRNGAVMVQNTAARIKTYSLQRMADFRCRILETHFDGMLLEVDGKQVWVHFLGRFNAYNLLSVYGTALLLGASAEEVLPALSALHSVSGRFEYIRSDGGVTAIVDYAHTPDALQNVMTTIDEIRCPEQQLIVVVGCGGNRDKTKRPEMARIAVRGADLAILTSDNPRLEQPEAILDDMKAGLQAGDRYLCIADRQQAIRTAVTVARRGDIILVAGKGHETYQDAGGMKHHFDDREQLREAFAAVGVHGAADRGADGNGPCRGVK